jgi:putative alpha-1,2-mannosidase
MRQPAILTAAILFASFCVHSTIAQSKQPVDYVSPNIGSVSQLLTPTMPFVQVPHDMARLAPVTTPGIQDRYLADKIFGFSPGVGMVMVSTGDVSTKLADYASDFGHDFETATPYYYAADLQTWSSKAEFTATRQTALYRFTLAASPHAHVVFSLGPGSELTVAGPNAVQGSQRITGTVSTAVDLNKETRLYFYAEFAKPFGSYQTWQSGELTHETSVRGDHIGFVTTQTTTAGEQVEVRVGISYISAEQAQRNLHRDTGGKSFEAIKLGTRGLWNNALGKVNITGAPSASGRSFNCALAVARPHDRYYRGLSLLLGLRPHYPRCGRARLLR